MTKAKRQVADPEVAWHLYVDESGNFDDQFRPVAVAGVLLADDAVPKDELLRQSLETAVPGFPWPWHTSWINLPMWLAIATVNSATDPVAADRIATPVLMAADRAVELIRGVAANEVEAVQAIVAAGDEPKRHREDLVDWWQLVCRDRPECTAPLMQHVQAALVALQRLFQPLSERSSATGPLPVAIFGASELIAGDAVGVSGGLDVGDRYLNLLAVTVQRAAAAVAQHGQRHRLNLHVLERRVRYRQLDTSLPMKTAMLNTVVGAIRGALPEGVTVVGHEVLPFKGNISPRFVLADFIANRMRGPLSRQHDALQAVEGRCSVECGLDPRAFLPRSPFAASGDAYRLVTGGAPEGVLPEVVLPVTAGRRRWACEQAWEWAVAR